MNNLKMHYYYYKFNFLGTYYIYRYANNPHMLTIKMINLLEDMILTISHSKAFAVLAEEDRDQLIDGFSAQLYQLTADEVAEQLGFGLHKDKDLFN